MKPAWDIGTVLYRRADPESAPGMLTGIMIRAHEVTTYLVSWTDEGEMEHWECELTEEKAL